MSHNFPKYNIERTQLNDILSFRQKEYPKDNLSIKRSRGTEIYDISMTKKVSRTLSRE